MLRRRLPTIVWYDLRSRHRWPLLSHHELGQWLLMSHMWLIHVKGLMLVLLLVRYECEVRRLMKWLLLLIRKNDTIRHSKRRWLLLLRLWLIRIELHLLLLLVEHDLLLLLLIKHDLLLLRHVPPAVAVVLAVGRVEGRREILHRLASEGL